MGDLSAGIVDEWLPAAGVRNGDLFWIVVEGPTLCVNTSEAGIMSNSVAGEMCHVATAAASTAEGTAGRVAKIDLPFTAAAATDGTAFDIMTKYIGRARTALTTGQTNTDILVDIQLLNR